MVDETPHLPIRSIDFFVSYAREDHTWQAWTNTRTAAGGHLKLCRPEAPTDQRPPGPGWGFNGAHGGDPASASRAAPIPRDPTPAAMKTLAEIETLLGPLPAVAPLALPPVQVQTRDGQTELLVRFNPDEPPPRR